MKNNYLEQFIFPPRVLSEREEQEMQSLSTYIINGGFEKKEFFDLLFNFFNSENFDKDVIKKYYSTYWTWFVKVAYRTINQTESNELLKFFVQSLPMAFALNIDVSGKFLNYLYIGFSTPTKRNEFGREIKLIIEKSEYPINIFSSEPVDFKSLMQKINLGIKEKKVVNAILFGKLENGIFKNTKTNRDTSEKMNITNNFVNFIAFFLKVKDYNEVVNKYFRALEGNERDLSVPQDDNVMVQDDSERDPSVPQDDKKATLDYKKIKDEVVFNFGEIGKMDVAQVLDYLKEKYPNDEKLKELIYFDEEKGEFKWNEDLIL